VCCNVTFSQSEAVQPESSAQNSPNKCVDRPGNLFTDVVWPESVRHYHVPKLDRGMDFPGTSGGEPISPPIRVMLCWVNVNACWSFMRGYSEATVQKGGYLCNFSKLGAESSSA
jgi:hypothetical protein